MGLGLRMFVVCIVDNCNVSGLIEVLLLFYCFGLVGFEDCGMISCVDVCFVFCNLDKCLRMVCKLI